MSDWQSRTTGIAQRCKFIFENKEMCDCEFIIGKKKVNKLNANNFNLCCIEK